MTLHGPGERPRWHGDQRLGPVSGQDGTPLSESDEKPLRAIPEARSGEPPLAAPRATVPRHPSAVPAAALPYQGRRAGLISRSLAATIDAVIVIGLLVVGYLVLMGARYMLSPKDFSFPDLRFVFAMAAFLGVLVVYLTAAWATTGRTYGDHVMGLRVVNARGRRMRWAGAFVRAVACAFVPIGLLWVAVSRENRSLHDLVLRTSVVYDWRDSPTGDAEAGIAGSTESHP